MVVQVFFRRGRKVKKASKRQLGRNLDAPHFDNNDTTDYGTNNNSGSKFTKMMRNWSKTEILMCGMLLTIR